jgi:hypothetical protein
MLPLNNARRRAWCAVISALAGGGVTVVSLGGPLSGALGATAAPTETPSPTNGTTAGSGAQAGAHEPATVHPLTSTSTTIPVPPPPSSRKPAATAPATATPAPASGEAPKVVLQRRQRPTPAKEAKPSQATTSTPTATGPNNVAPSPQLIAGQAAALAAALASSSASVQALGFYRIPLFLLPIYKAAAVQYGVPWQILAAINEIETNYGTDQSVSTAGAVGWMQFMPETWLQYGVDALDAGYADPYNPVDAIFAAARYLRAAGAASDLHAAILAYNHSEEYVSSVLLRARLISSYPGSVIATLTGLTDGRVPVTGKRVAWAPAAASPSSATANAAPLGGSPTAATTGSPASSGASAAQTGTPGSSPAAAPSASAAKAKAAPAPMQLADLMSAPNASVVAVQDGRVVDLGVSSRLGRYIVLRDVYGDLFTYAGLGSIAPSYTPSKPAHAPVKSPVVEAASTRDPTPSQPASAGRQPPVTLKVKTHAAPAAASKSAAAGQGGSGEAGSAGIGKVRLFARPGNPDALAAAKAAKNARRTSAGDRLPLRRGAVVASGTILGRVRVPQGASDGHLRFAIRPVGDSATIDPRPILANWEQLAAALHPRGARAENALLGATASDVLLMSAAQLEHTVLADPGITIDGCARHEIASGKLDRRVLAVLAFLSRSGLKPAASVPHCGQGLLAAGGSASARGVAEAVEITAINGIAIASHQGAGTITDLTIRTLLTMPAGFVPHAITSLMRYPGAPNTHAVPSYFNRIRLAYQPAAPKVPLSPAAAAAAARSARSARTAAFPPATPAYVSANQWEQLMRRIGALPVPSVATKPSSAAIADPKRPSR